jgi:hypothetical protein
VLLIIYEFAIMNESSLRLDNIMRRVTLNRVGNYVVRYIKNDKYGTLQWDFRMKNLATGEHTWGPTVYPSKKSALTEATELMEYDTPAKLPHRMYWSDGFSFLIDNFRKVRTFKKQRMR